VITNFNDDPDRDVKRGKRGEPESKGVPELFLVQHRDRT